MRTAEEKIKESWQLEMRQRDDDPGHWYSWGQEHDSITAAVWVRDNCWKPKSKRGDSVRIVRYTTTKAIERLAKSSEGGK